MVKNLSIFTKLHTPIVLLDKNLEVQGYSDKFLKEFAALSMAPGMAIKNLRPFLPKRFFKDLEIVQRSKTEMVGEGSVLLAEGKLQWYKWTMSAIEEEDFIILATIENCTKAKISEELYKTSETVARIGSWEADLVNNRLYWSDMTKNIHEVPLDYVPSLETGINFYKSGYSRDKITQCVEEGILTGKPWDVELQIVTQNGRVLWVHAKGNADVIEGKCVRLYGTFQDIDDKKRSALAYQKTAERLALATAKSGIGIWEFDLINEEVYWDKTLCNVFDYQVEEGDIFDYWKKFVAKGELKKIYETIENATPENNKYDATYIFSKPNLGIKWIKAAGTIIFDEFGEKVKVVGVSEDVTAFKQTQMKLNTVEKSMETTFTNSAVGMALVDTNGKISQVNKALCNSIGYKESELLDSNIRTLMFPEDVPARREKIDRLIEGEHDSYQEEIRLLSKNGETVYNILNVTSHKNLHGFVTHLIVQLVDITSMRQTKLKLENLLDISTKQNESLINFAHIVSHNLRSHASNLTMITGLMIDNDIEPAEKEQTLHMLQDASISLNETIYHLNEVVQVKVNANVNLKRIPIYEQIQSVVQSLSALLEKNAIFLSICCEPEVKVLGVAAYVESIIHNLMTNAIKYRDKSKNAFVKVNVTNTAQKVKLSVEDNGLGIDLKKHKSKLFGMYKTFHNHPEAKGVGLYIVKNQVEAMGAKIKVESELEKGTTFIVEFKRAVN